MSRTAASKSELLAQFSSGGANNSLLMNYQNIHLFVTVSSLQEIVKYMCLATQAVYHAERLFKVFLRFDFITLLLNLMTSSLLKNAGPG